MHTFIHCFITFFFILIKLYCFCNLIEETSCISNQYLIGSYISSFLLYHILILRNFTRMHDVSMVCIVLDNVCETNRCDFSSMMLQQLCVSNSCISVHITLLEIQICCKGLRKRCDFASMMLCESRLKKGNDLCRTKKTHLKREVEPVKLLLLYISVKCMTLP